MKEKEKKLLKELLSNGREKISALAEKVGLSRQTVSKKIDELKEEEIIKSFTVEVNDEKIGLNERAYIIATLDPDSDLREKFTTEARELKEIRQIYYLFGRFDVVLEVITTDEERLDELIDKIHSFKAVKETETLICREAIKQESKDPFLEALED